VPIGLARKADVTVFTPAEPSSAEPFWESVGVVGQFPCICGGTDGSRVLQHSRR